MPSPASAPAVTDPKATPALTALTAGTAVTAVTAPSGGGLPTPGEALPVPTIPGLRKAAVLMVALGADASANVLRLMTQDEVEQISWEIARVKEVPPPVMQMVVTELLERLDGAEYLERSGIDFVRDVLERAVGTDKAREILSRLGRRPSSNRPFEVIRTLDPTQLFQIVQGEHPQTIALIVSYLPVAAAAMVLSGLPQEVQTDVASRVANMDATTPDVVQQIETVIMERLSSVETQNVTNVGGTLALVEILNQVDRSTERTILDGLSEAHPALADAIKERMFVFEDIFQLDNRTVQAVLREVEQEDLRLALKGVGENVREIVFKNISERAAETLKEDIELMGPVRVRDVEASQKRIVAIVRRLEEAGEVTLRRSKEDELIE